MRAQRISVLLAVGSVFVALALLGVRSLTSLDLGFNMDYGRAFLASGRIVDHAGFLYTLPAPGEARPEPGPGAWYDGEGRYRFANASWLSQAVMAGVHAAAGPSGLVALGALLVLAVHGLVYFTMRRTGVPALAALGGLCVFALAAFERFNLRPEVFGFAILAAQSAILTPLALDVRRELSRSSIAALVLLQGLAANAHGYFLLGIALAAAVSADRLARRLRNGSTHWLPVAGALGGMAAASFLNPWTWRGAWLPIETLAYLRKHDVTGGPGDHPWSHIAELRGTLGKLGQINCQNAPRVR